jgi:geranylgeranyl diphosphate synthase, type II
MELNGQLKEYRSKIYQTIDEYLPTLGDEHPPEIVYLRKAMRYLITDRKGSLSRPLLSLAVSRMYGVNEQIALDLSVSAETTHVASLVLDDKKSQDDALTRRGKRCTHLHFGEQTTDMAIHRLKDLGNEIILGLPLPKHLITRTIEEHAKTAERMFEGQTTDLRGKDDSLDVILRMYADKTSALLGYSLTSPAIVAEAPEYEIDALRQMGENLGIWYQINDDFKDYCRNPYDVGKDTRHDRRNVIILYGEETARNLRKDYREGTLRYFERLPSNSDFLEALITSKLVQEVDNSC